MMETITINGIEYIRKDKVADAIKEILQALDNKKEKEHEV